MFTVTVPRADVTSDEVAEALRNGLPSRYNVVPGERMSQHLFGHPRPDLPDAILVGKGSNRVLRAEVNIVRRSGQTELRIRPGGVLGQLVVNTFGLAFKVRRVLASAPGLRSPSGGAGR
jgi:hypothetical protein